MLLSQPRKPSGQLASAMESLLLMTLAEVEAAKKQADAELEKKNIALEESQKLSKTHEKKQTFCTLLRADALSLES